MPQARLSDLLKQAALRHLPRPALMSQCAVCKSWPSQQVCAACVSRFTPTGPRCRQCALRLPPGYATDSEAVCIACLRQPPPIDRALTCFDYGYPWSDVIGRYKFGEWPGLAPFLARLMLGKPDLLERFTQLEPADLVIPIPLADARLQTRGFNQAWELAHALATLSRTPARADAKLLLRTQSTRPQTELKREARAANVHNAFQLEPLRAGLVDGRSVVLVDDVMTTGASLFSAAKALRLAGAAHITAVVLARTPAP